MPPTRGFIVWDKGITMPNYSHVEYAWSSFDYPAHRYKHTSNFDKKHPTQKPEELMHFCLQYGNAGTKNHKVFDPFMGSGTTALACKSLGLDFWGCELDEDYHKIIEKRLSAVQGSLF